MNQSIAWRKSPERVAQAHQVIHSRAMQEMLAVLELDHPAKNIPTVNDGFGSTEQLGIIKGYERCLTRLRELAVSMPNPPDILSATWGAEKAIEENQQKP